MSLSVATERESWAQGIDVTSQGWRETPNLLTLHPLIGHAQKA